MFMLYYNTIIHYGVDAFVKKCTQAGVDGMIIPDLPFEEQGEIKEALRNTPDAPVLVQLVSPVSKKRVPMILEDLPSYM